MSDEGPAGRDERSGGDRWPRLHLWEIQPVRDVLVLLAILAVVYLGYLLSPLTVPMLIALLLAYLFEPLVQRMTRVSWVSRQGAAVAIIVGVVLFVLTPVVIGLGYGVVSAAESIEDAAQQAREVARVVGSEEPREELDELRGLWRSAAEQIIDVMEERDQPEPSTGGPVENEADGDGAPSLPAMEPETSRAVVSGDAGEEVDQYTELREALERDDMSPTRRMVLNWMLTGVEWVRSWSDETWKKIGGEVFRGGVTVASVIFGILVWLGMTGFSLFLTAFFFFFFSVGFGKVLAFTEQFIPKKHHEQAIYLIRRMDGVVSGFVRGRLTICVIQCVVFAIGYTLVGVPGGIILGLIVGVLAIVPYLAMVGIPAAIILMALDPSEGFRGAWWWIVLAPTAVYFLTQALDDYVLTPTIQGKATGMDTPTVLFCALAGGLLAGIYGLLLAIPVGACIKILLEELLWPRIEAWAQGRRRDPLPISASEEEDHT